MKKLLIPFFLCLIISKVALAQVGIGTSTPDANAQLDVSSNDKGLLIPRITKATRELMSSPANGLLIYQTNDEKGFYYRQNGAWLRLPDTPATTIIPFTSGSTPATVNYQNSSAYQVKTGAVIGTGATEIIIPLSVTSISSTQLVGSYALNVPVNGVIKSLNAYFETSLITYSEHKVTLPIMAIIYACPPLGNVSPP
jgi:hypothetical protein